MKDCVVEIEQSFDLSLENDRFNGLVKSGDYATIKRVVDFVEYYKTVTVKSKHIFSITEQTFVLVAIIMYFSQH